MYDGPSGPSPARLCAALRKRTSSKDPFLGHDSKGTHILLKRFSNRFDVRELPRTPPGLAWDVIQETDRAGLA
ncbi:hypothetical protein Enr13x_78710 [Stieleria neptunia]|uniref:Uncharacterized protein n=1 Tax=Stieleria neptunia TaxID=2527979 RepID=A0A518I4C7_9BACT|nr:hypothetical protein Enr13x_78710 [Stieleria neptunia]